MTTLIRAACGLLLLVLSANTLARDPGTQTHRQPVLQPKQLSDLRLAGLQVFARPFLREDGFGDGFTTQPGLSFGNRPTLAGNRMNLRVNGIDAQTCNECHSIVSNATVPATFGVGGSGSTATLAMFMGSPESPGAVIDPATGAFNGRVIDPPALFGVGGVELLGKEMTADLQALKAQALAQPGTIVALRTKGVDFGRISADASGTLDTRYLEGIDEDLVVRPFGRKGEFATVHQFDLGALQFHIGIQATEVVGEGVDADGDGVVNEASAEDVRALHVFLTTQEHPRQSPAEGARRGLRHFRDIGCADCHRPALNTRSVLLPYTLKQIDTQPFAGIEYSADLSKAPARFPANRIGGVGVPLFSDLKHHDMGEGLSEHFRLNDAVGNRTFITTKLWGVADSAPYLHDGRAHTLGEAIAAHGGEAQAARDAFVDLSTAQRDELVGFLSTLRAPRSPNKDVVPGQTRRR